jgi:hypothetical protein
VTRGVARHNLEYLATPRVNARNGCWLKRSKKAEVQAQALKYSAEMVRLVEQHGAKATAKLTPIGENRRRAWLAGKEPGR